MDNQHNDAALKRAHGFKGPINRSRLLRLEVKSPSCHVLLRPTWISAPAQGTLEGFEYQIQRVTRGFHTVVISFPEIQLTYYTSHAPGVHNSIAVFLRHPQSSGMITQFGPFLDYRRNPAPFAVFSPICPCLLSPRHPLTYFLSLVLPLRTFPINGTVWPFTRIFHRV